MAGFSFRGNRQQALKPTNSDQACKLENVHPCEHYHQNTITSENIVEIDDDIPTAKNLFAPATLEGDIKLDIMFDGGATPYIILKKEVWDRTKAADGGLEEYLKKCGTANSSNLNILGKSKEKITIKFDGRKTKVAMKVLVSDQITEDAILGRSTMKQLNMSIHHDSNEYAMWQGKALPLYELKKI